MHHVPRLLSRHSRSTARLLLDSCLSSFSGETSVPFADVGRVDVLAPDPSPGASSSCRRASRTGKPSRLRSHHFTILVEFTVRPPNTGRHRGPKSGALGSPLSMPNGPRMSGGAKPSWFTPSSPLTTPPVARRAASRLRPDPEGSRTLPASGEHCAAGSPVPTRDESSQAWACS